MSLPQAALRRPLTVVVMVIAIALASTLAWLEMPKDIFPEFNLPTIYVAQAYGGMDPAQMEGYLVYFFEYHFLYLTGIEHVESKSTQGAALMKLQFHPGTDMSQAMAETVAYVNRARSFMPPGTVPPLITRFDAGSVPTGYLVFTSDTRSITEMQDAALNRVRPLLSTLPGVSAPPPFGGNARSIVVNLKPDRLKSYHMSPDEVAQAIAEANVVSPSGNIMKGGKYPLVPVNSVPRNIDDLRAAPIRGGEYPAVFVRDVADVKDDSDIVTCYALVNGKRAIYVPVTKRADASTLSVAREVRESLAKFQGVLPSGVKVSFEMDRSPVVTHALAELPWEGCIGALLTGLMVIFFLRDWRSALVVVVNIPIALMAGVVALWLSGETINLMTLGGLALAVGILVDTTTVCMENIHVHLARGQSLAPRRSGCYLGNCRPPPACHALHFGDVYACPFHDGRSQGNVFAARIGGRLYDGRLLLSFQHACAGPYGLDLAHPPRVIVRVAMEGLAERLCIGIAKAGAPAWIPHIGLSVRHDSGNCLYWRASGNRNLPARGVTRIAIAFARRARNKH